MLKGKHILLGVTGSIAAYKAAILVRALVKEGAEVKVVMTEMAKQFITPLTLATLSKNPILVEFFDPENGQWNSHVSLGLWADLYLIAPASANTLAKMANGIADNLLLTSYLSSRSPVAVAPAMDLDMYAHPSVRASLDILSKWGVHIIEPASGELASGLDGKGRMEEPEKIISNIKYILSQKESLVAKRVLITAGPTIEEIDPVRFISNHSSGKMAYAIAESFAARGADVKIVSGPVKITTNTPNISVYNVKSASEMAQKTEELYADVCDIVVLCAAVADYTPQTRADGKIKRDGNNLSIDLVPTTDIAARLGQIKKDKTIHIGFALETDNEHTNACLKLKKKNLDMIVLNSLSDKGAGFSGDTNKITIYNRGGERFDYPLKSKAEVADDIVQSVEKLLLCSKG